jgi:hypothetical protein
MKRTALFAVAFAGIAACEAPPSAPTPTRLDPTATEPSRAVIFNERIPIAFTTVNPCPPAEPVALAGEVHIVQQQKDGEFKTHVNLANFHGVGLVTGDRYTAQDNAKAEFDGATIQVTERFRLIRQGSNDNFHVIVTFTFPPGTFTFDSECRG